MLNRAAGLLSSDSLAKSLSDSLFESLSDSLPDSLPERLSESPLEPLFETISRSESSLPLLSLCAACCC